MSIISEEFLAARTGEVLEARLRKSDKYRQKMEDLHKASGVFSKAAGLSKNSMCSCLVSGIITAGTVAY